MSVVRAQQEITSREFAEWLAFSMIEGPGAPAHQVQQSVEEMQERLRMHLGMIGALKTRR